MRQRVAVLGTVLGLGIGVPFTTGVTPAYAQAQLSILKTAEGNFQRGLSGFYRITVRNSGTESTDGATTMTDVLPDGLTVNSISIQSSTTDTLTCGTPGSQTLQCQSSQMDPGDSYEVAFAVDIPDDAPCAVENTATVTDGVVTRSSRAAAIIPGPNCDLDSDGNSGNPSILPINLSGVISVFNNITTNSNIHSPAATNVSAQNFHPNVN
jgi:uncharacterized repeat protein (TIGR01451 family)